MYITSSSLNLFLLILNLFLFDPCWPSASSSHFFNHTFLLLHICNATSSAAHAPRLPDLFRPLRAVVQQPPAARIPPILALLFHLGPGRNNLPNPKHLDPEQLHQLDTGKRNHNLPAVSAQITMVFIPRIFHLFTRLSALNDACPPSRSEVLTVRLRLYHRCSEV